MPKKKKQWSVSRMDEYGKSAALVISFPTKKEAEDYVLTLDDYHRYKLVSTFM